MKASHFASLAPDNDSAEPIRVCFFFNAQRHQLLHGISTAVELARTSGFEVHILSPDPGHIAYAGHVAEALGGAPLHFTLASPALLAALREKNGASLAHKALSLGLVARELNRFDAVALPERTTIRLKRFGAPSPRYIHLDHGAGDRAISFDPRIAQFDMVLMAGEKHRARLMRDGLIRPGRHAVVGYPKFEAADAVRDAAWRPFGNGRPTVLYNPHFSALGSWKVFGESMLNAFAAQDRYNLIVAPHVRMLDGKARKAKWRALADAYAGIDHIHIDLGTERLVDMTYTTLADVYVGDVSSQVYEFLRTPKPCVFLDQRGIDWRSDEDYAHWRYGPVARTPGAVLETIDAAITGHDDFQEVQRQGFAETFAENSAPASRRAADAIAAYLAASGRQAANVPRLGVKAARAAGLIFALAAGWLAHDAIGPAAGPAHAAPTFVEEAVTSHKATLMRAAMRSRSETPNLNTTEIRRVTGLKVPAIPVGWRLTDVQIYPSDFGPIVQVAAVTDQSETVSIVAMHADTPAGRRPMLRTHDGEGVAFWEDASQAYGVVGSLSSQRLMRLAGELAPRT
ncbi:hypothetical protein [Phenylobacterium immobile]|uniref:hypothetical protein n=1 Tax=Phenylobacterium immobile TaxID=21 RepID=UPI000AFFCE56|nr:hypothetical protein [Phenylobacterium immobile]